MAIPYLSSTSDINALVKPLEGVVVLHFTAAWSEACKQIHTVLETLNKDANSAVTIIEVDAESVPELSMKYLVKAVPTIIFTKQGVLFDRVDGAHAAQITAKIRQCRDGIVPLNSQIINKPHVETQQELNSRLKALIGKHKCMLFMKGSPDAPQCGFSRQLIQMMNNLNADYDTFDILSDESVRQGLKKYSNWPTFPQVYVDNELIGGLDILKEMETSGDLEATIPKKQSKADLNARLESLIKRSPVMIFMKGDRNAPRCKFSKALMAIIEKQTVQFDTFDILENEEVRQSLKEYSNWPTYPQIYVNGELIGGIDIVQELNESGELESALKGQ